MEEAETFRNRRRKVMPAVYNPARLHEQPIPLLVLVSPDDISNISTSSGDISLNRTKSNDVEDDPLESLDNSLSVGAIGQHSANDSLTQSAPATEPVANDNTDGSSEEIRNNATMDDLTLDQLRIAPANQQQQLQQPANQANIKKEPFAALAEADSNAAENLFSSSFENCVDGDDDLMICRRDETPKPKYDISGYDFAVKKMDILSGNLAFAENVSNSIFKFQQKTENISIFNIVLLLLRMMVIDIIYSRLEAHGKV